MALLVAGIDFGEHLTEGAARDALQEDYAVMIGLSLFSVRAYGDNLTTYRLRYYGLTGGHELASRIDQSRASIRRSARI